MKEEFGAFAPPRDTLIATGVRSDVARYVLARVLANAIWNCVRIAAPLAYTGLGLLVIANRLVDPDAPEWSQWILLLALGHFVGNFVFSLTDHAQNGFFHPAEWIPVVASACAIGRLIVPFIVDVPAAYFRLILAVLAGEALVGVLGFGLHAFGDVRGFAPTMLDKILSGAPPMALLFVNLSILAAIALAARLTPHR